MLFRISSILTLLMASGCAFTAFHGPVPDISRNELLSGEAIFGHRIDTSGIADPGLLDVDDDMRAFVDEHVDARRADRDRMRRLLSSMIETGLMSLDYSDTATKTASRTFHDRVGNCISFTSLFVALGREAGLDVTFQTVEVPPMWHTDSDLVILNDHVNALVKQSFESRVVVDFNVAEMKGNYPAIEVSDEYALALYFNNVAMDALRAGNDEKAFRLLKRSIETHDKIAANWANLGVIYSRNGANDYAIRAYAAALELDKNHRQSLTNLAALYRSEGREDVANRYSRRIKRYQQQNPYYHYYSALSAYDSNDFGEALKRLEHALRLKSTDDKFYNLQGLIYEQLGDPDMALHSFTRARDLAVFSDARTAYSNKIAELSNEN